MYKRNAHCVSFRFLGCEDPDSFFSRAQRSRMVWEILATAPFGKEKKGEVGVERLVEEGAYSAAFPLHDVRTSLLSLSLFLHPAVWKGMYSAGHLSNILYAKDCVFTEGRFTLAQ